MSVSFGSWLQYNPDDFRGAALVAPGGDIVAAVNAAFRKRKASETETGGVESRIRTGGCGCGGWNSENGTSQLTSERTFDYMLLGPLVVRR